MLLSRFRYYTGFLVFLDAVGIVVVFVVTYAFRHLLLTDIAGLAPLISWEYYLPLMVFFIPVWLTMLLWFEGYSVSLRKDYLRWAFDLSVKTTLGGVLAIGAYLFISKSTHISRTFLLLCAVGNGLFIFTVRAAFYLYIQRIGRNNYFAKHLLVVGTKTASEKVLQSIRDHVRWGLHIKDFIEIEETDGEESGVRLNGKFQEVLERVKKCVNIKDVAVDEVVVCLPKEQILRFESIGKICAESGVRVSLLCDLFPTQNPQIHVTTLHGLGMITIDPTLGRERKYFIKRLMDLMLASVLLVLLAPFMLLVGIVIKLTSRGPMIFRQRRVGLNGRLFEMLKFRTMVEGAEDRRGEIDDLNILDGPVFKAAHDPRLTPVGRFLRRAFIDELPQLFNVIKGEMSLVGPRPPLPSEVRRYKLWYSKRLSMKPGITGLWQVEGRSKLVSFEEWMWMDLDYIENWSLWLDVKILLKTIPEVLRCTGV